jgi:hypothetical protein
MDPPAEKNSVFATGDQEPRQDGSHQPTVVHDADRALTEHSQMLHLIPSSAASLPSRMSGV